MSASTHSDIIRRDSGIKVDNDTKFHNGPLEPYNHALAGDNVANDSSVDIEYNISYTFKRTFSDANLGRSDSSETAAKKGKVSNNSVSTGDKHQRRVLCPFYKKDPEKHAQTVSCHNKGFEEMSRLKQHLVQVHRVSKTLLDFKNRSFQDLGTIEAKWTQVYRVLFPDDLEENIPAPYKHLNFYNIRNQAQGHVDNDSTSIQKPGATPATSNATVYNILEAIMDRNDDEPGFAVAISVMLDKKLQSSKNINTVPKENYGLLSPPTSTISSPEMHKMDTSTTSDFRPETFDDNHVDPLSSPLPTAGSTPSFELMDVGFAWPSPGTSPATAQSVNTLDMTVPQTTNDWPFIDVCFKCLSTDIIYGFPSALVAEAQPLSGNFDHTADSSPALALTERVSPFMGAVETLGEAAAMFSLDLDTIKHTWISSETYRDAALEKEKNLDYEFFDFESYETQETY